MDEFNGIELLREVHLKPNPSNLGLPSAPKHQPFNVLKVKKFSGDLLSISHHGREETSTGQLMESITPTFLSEILSKNCQGFFTLAFKFSVLLPPRGNEQEGREVIPTSGQFSQECSATMTDDL